MIAWLEKGQQSCGDGSHARTEDNRTETRLDRINGLLCRLTRGIAVSNVRRTTLQPRYQWNSREQLEKNDLTISSRQMKPIDRTRWSITLSDQVHVWLYRQS